MALPGPGGGFNLRTSTDFKIKSFLTNIQVFFLEVTNDEFREVLGVVLHLFQEEIVISADNHFMPIQARAGSNCFEQSFLGTLKLFVSYFSVRHFVSKSWEFNTLRQRIGGWRSLTHFSSPSNSSSLCWPTPQQMTSQFLSINTRFPACPKERQFALKEKPSGCYVPLISRPR